MGIRSDPSSDPHAAVTPTAVRLPSAAGRFYPDHPAGLRAMIDSLLACAPASPPLGARPKALIAPHAGYVCSGPIAARAYASLRLWRTAFSRVVLIGPAHFMDLEGIGLCNCRAFATPLGSIPVDWPAAEPLLALPHVHLLHSSDRGEHSLEVHLPFLQVVLEHFSIVPLLLGACTADAVAEVLGACWDGPSTLLVISSDLSHYYPYEDARDIDRLTARAIESLDPLALGEACGERAIQGLLLLASSRHLSATTLDLRNSGDTTGRKDRVVGYGAFSFVEPSSAFDAP